jgi:hypothetical protein
VDSVGDASRGMRYHINDVVSDIDEIESCPSCLFRS